MRSGRTGPALPPSAPVAGLALLAFLPLLAGCPSSPPPAPPPTIPPSVVRNVPPPPAVPADKPAAGSTFNRYFPPKNTDGYTLKYTQEKQGVAQAELTKGGKKVALLTISDTTANPSARSKYATSSKQIGGYPSATLGSKITSVLVADRWQVQVNSVDPSLTPADREAWLQKFDLAGLASVK